MRAGNVLRLCLYKVGVSGTGLLSIAPSMRCSVKLLLKLRYRHRKQACEDVQIYLGAWVYIVWPKFSQYSLEITSKPRKLIHSLIVLLDDPSIPKNIFSPLHVLEIVQLVE